MLLKFSEWVDVLNEAQDPGVDEARRNRPQGGAGGAFGRSGGGYGGNRGGRPGGQQNRGGGNTPGSAAPANTGSAAAPANTGSAGPTNTGGGGAYTHTRDQQRSLKSYDARIAFGKTQEKKMFAAAAQDCGLKVTPASAYEDMHLKIDGWWWPEGGGGKEPFSMKYRDTGDDVLFEVIKPYRGEPILDPKNRLGRDVKPPGAPADQFSPSSSQGAKYIFFLSRAGNKLSVIEAEPCYTAIQSMLEEINEKGWNQEARGGRKVHVSASGVMRWQTDQSSGVQKVMAYVPLRVATPIFQCDVNIAIE